MRLGDVTWKPGDEIFLGAEKTLKVLKVLPVDEPDSRHTGFLMVEPS
jgi:hypothetical protein